MAPRSRKRKADDDAPPRRKRRRQSPGSLAFHGPSDYRLPPERRVTRSVTAAATQAAPQPALQPALALQPAPAPQPGPAHAPLLAAQAATNAASQAVAQAAAVLQAQPRQVVQVAVQVNVQAAVQIAPQAPTQAGDAANREPLTPARPTHRETAPSPDSPATRARNSSIKKNEEMRDAPPSPSDSSLSCLPSQTPSLPSDYNRPASPATPPPARRTSRVPTPNTRDFDNSSSPLRFEDSEPSLPNVNSGAGGSSSGAAPHSSSNPPSSSPPQRPVAAAPPASPLSRRSPRNHATPPSQRASQPSPPPQPQPSNPHSLRSRHTIFNELSALRRGEGPQDLATRAALYDEAIERRLMPHDEARSRIERDREQARLRQQYPELFGLDAYGNRLPRPPPRSPPVINRDPLPGEGLFGRDAFPLQAGRTEADQAAAAAAAAASAAAAAAWAARGARGGRGAAPAAPAAPPPAAHHGDDDGGPAGAPVIASLGAGQGHSIHPAPVAPGRPNPAPRPTIARTNSSQPANATWTRFGPQIRPTSGRLSLPAVGVASTPTASSMRQSLPAPARGTEVEEEIVDGDEVQFKIESDLEDEAQEQEDVVVGNKEKEDEEEEEPPLPGDPVERLAETQGKYGQEVPPALVTAGRD